MAAKNLDEKWARRLELLKRSLAGEDVTGGRELNGYGATIYLPETDDFAESPFWASEVDPADWWVYFRSSAEAAEWFGRHRFDGFRSAFRVGNWLVCENERDMEAVLQSLRKDFARRSRRPQARRSI